MKRTAVCLLSLVVSMGVIPRFAMAAESRQGDDGEITTLYALDAVTSHLSLNDGKPGSAVQDHPTYNRDSQLSFNTYAANSFTVGIQGREDGAIVDLGGDDALKARYGYTETVGNVQGFASIHLDGGQAVIVKDYGTHQFQPLKEFGALTQQRDDGNVTPVVLGHMYLIRISRDGAVALYAKLKVLAYVPGQYVTIRWSRL